MSRATMPAGKYYVGDLGYVIPDSYWDELCSKAFPEAGVMKQGLHTVADQQLVIFTTAYGDGTYYDQMQREYCVDSGTIGCISCNSLAAMGAELTKVIEDELGQIIEFSEDFSCYYSDGTARFGLIAISTGDYYDELDEEDFDDF